MLLKTQELKAGHRDGKWHLGRRVEMRAAFASGHFISAQEARPGRRGRQNVAPLMCPSTGYILSSTGSALWK